MFVASRTEFFEFKFFWILILSIDQNFVVEHEFPQVFLALSAEESEECAFFSCSSHFLCKLRIKSDELRIFRVTRADFIKKLSFVKQ
jgi:hypothetical protein